MANCPYCKNYISTKEPSKNYKGTKVHLACFEKMLDDLEAGDTDREELNRYICKLFSLKKITPLIDSQINNFVSINGYTLKGIQGTLYYFFELEEREVGEDVKGIGIVPFVYDEAKDYFSLKSKALEENRKFNKKTQEVSVRVHTRDYSVPKIDISKIE
jgi:hypothetical protein